MQKYIQIMPNKSHSYLYFSPENFSVLYRTYILVFTEVGEISPPNVIFPLSASFINHGFLICTRPT
jgi:hypothetical protein